MNTQDTDPTEHDELIKNALLQAELKAGCLSHLIDNSAPIMTHDIETDGCTGLADCPTCNITTPHH